MRSTTKRLFVVLSACAILATTSAAAATRDRGAAPETIQKRIVRFIGQIAHLLHPTSYDDNMAGTKP